MFAEAGPHLNLFLRGLLVPGCSMSKEPGRLLTLLYSVGRKRLEVSVNVTNFSNCVLPQLTYALGFPSVFFQTMRTIFFFFHSSWGYPYSGAATSGSG